MATKSRKRTFHQYTESALSQAVQETKAKTISLCGASRKYGVLRATIQDQIHGRVAEDHPRKMGPSTVLNSSEKSLLVKWCTDLAKCGFPLKMTRRIPHLTVDPNANGMTVFCDGIQI